MARILAIGTATLVVLSQLGHACAFGGEIHHSPAFPPVEVKDTLGAGDTFNARLIDAYLKDLELAEALSHACRLVGKKCGQNGLEGLGANHSRQRVSFLRK